MKRLSHAKKRDANELEIVHALEQIGASVERQDNPTDLIVGYHGQTYLIEVKMPGAKLTPDQIKFIDEWRGGPVHIVSSIQSAIDVVTR